MNRTRLGVLLTAAMVVVPASRVCSQAAPAPQAEFGPKVGEMAPDFEFTGITRYGKLANAKKLSDFRGQTVVLAFFPRARSRG